VGRIYGDPNSPVEALRGVSFTVDHGEMVAIAGPSGSGKSTLLNLIGMLDAPSSGRIVINGIDVGGLSEDEKAVMRNEEIGFIFQFSNLIPELTALENVMLPGMIGKKNGFDLRKKAIDRLTQVGLSSKARSGASTLSGGEMQRVAIARSLINDPSLVLADEPTGNLDSKNSEELINLMRDLNKKNNQTFAIISHDHKIVAKCDRVIRIRDGMIEDQEDDVGSSDVTSTGDKSLNDKKTLEKLREENKILRTRLGKLEQKRR
tara:strand:+ start:2099 stop:2884 length:786 start_codon:yes stop_codon:yes gene_type:complete